MQPHTKVYMTHFGYGEQDYIACEACHLRRAVDVHHLIPRSHGGKDVIINLIGLCRFCHQLAHDKPEFNEHLKLLASQR